MEEITANVNWLAVGVGFVLAYLLGFVWYGFLFGKAWAEGHGLAGPPEKLPVMAMSLQAAGTFLLAWLFGITAARDALLTVILIVLTIICLMAAGAFYTMRPAKVAAIETGFVATMAVVLFLIQALL